MLLVVDVGNTQTVVGLYAPDSARPGCTEQECNKHWRLATTMDRTPDELALIVSQFLALSDLQLDRDVTGLAVSSVVPRQTAAFREFADRYLPDRPTVVLAPGMDVGMAITYDNPNEVGADRLANAIGAVDRYGAPVIIVDFGTATTIDIVSTQGAYMGGIILPGIEISLDALFARTAALRRVELVEPRSVIGKTTIESIQSGAIYGFAAQVDGLVDRVTAILGTAPIIATGGLATLIAPHTKHTTVTDPWLTLHGLRVIFERVA